MKLIVPLPEESLLDLGRRCNAVYVCPKVDGVRKGPLVVYAGKDQKNRNLVGDIYFNFRRIEEHPAVVQEFAEQAADKLQVRRLQGSFDTIVGIPQGGRTFGQALAYVMGKRFTYADKKSKPTESGKKQEYEWDLSQFDFEMGERVAVVEDVVNNFQNTDNTLAEVSATSANVVLLVSALNRSPVYDAHYMPQSGVWAGRTLPVVASIREAYPEYEQDDSAVAVDVAVGNVEWEVKKNWARLMELSK
jgi:orotate phosphoribosyltransferase-like protein